MNTAQHCQAIHAALVLGTNVDVRPVSQVRADAEASLHVHGCPVVYVPIDRALARGLGWIVTRPNVRPRDMTLDDAAFSCGAATLCIDAALWDLLGREWPFDRINARRRKAGDGAT